MGGHILIVVGQSKVEWWNSGTGAWVQLGTFSLPSYCYPVCVSGTITDLWVGIDGSGISPYNKPWLRRWNGSSWSASILSSFGTAINPQVSAVLRISPVEAYCIANESISSPDARLMRWNGSSWSDLGGLQIYGPTSQLWQDSLGRVWAAGNKTTVLDRVYMWDGSLHNVSDGDSSVNAMAVHGLGTEVYTYKGNGKLRVGSYGGSWSQIGDDPHSPSGTPCLQTSASYVWTCYKESSGAYNLRVVRRDRPTGSGASDTATGSTHTYSRFVVLGDGDHQFVVDNSGVRRRDGVGSWSLVNRGYTVQALCGYSDTTPPQISNQSPASGSIARKGATISFDATKSGLFGLDPALTQVWVAGVLVFSSEKALNFWSVTTSAISDGLHYICEWPSRPGHGAVSVRVVAKDVAGNTVDTTWTYGVQMAMGTTSELRECLYIGDGGDAMAGDDGLLLDASPRTKCLLALRARRGHYFADREYGSRLREIKTLDEGRQVADHHCREALQFLIDRGEILGCSVDSAAVETDAETGMLAVPLNIRISENDLVNLRVLSPLGG